MTVSSVNCVWIDVDCLGGTHTAPNLPTKAQAVTYIESFNPPPSIIVETSGGFHVYWLFDKIFLITDESRQEAIDFCGNWNSMIARDFLKEGWKLDPTGDLARVLRLPETKNYKDKQNVGNVNLIKCAPDVRYNVETIKGIVKERLPVVTPATATQPREGTFDEKLFDNCNFIKHCKDDAKTLSEPEWVSMIAICVFAPGGVEAAHKLSAPYAKYNHRATDKKISAALKLRGPVRCLTIAKNFPGYCENCKFNVKNPLLTLKTEEAKEKKKDTFAVLGESVELFLDTYDSAFMRVPVKGHQELLELDSIGAKRWLINSYYAETGDAPKSESVKQALSVLDARARFEGEKIDPGLRVTGDKDKNIWYDLANDSWQAVKITKDGWSVEDSPPPLFRRRANTAAQITPERTDKGNINLLLDFVNIEDPNEQQLFQVGIVLSFIPDIPHEVDIFTGDHGSAKSTAMRVKRKIVDPARMELHMLPKDKQDLGLILMSNWAPAFDNLDGMPSDISDTLCQGSTGGGTSKRALYTNSDEIIYNFKRCISLNGINDPATRADLLDRGIFFNLKRIDETEYKTEETFWNEFEIARPKIMGSIFSIMSEAMGTQPDVKLERLPRMADMAVWGYAIAEAITPGGGQTYMEALKANREGGNEEALRSSPVSMAIIAMMKGKETWGPGTAAKLLEVLDLVCYKERIDTTAKTWPKSASSLTKKIKVVRVNLLNSGLEVIEEYDQHEKNTKYKIVNRTKKESIGKELSLAEVIQLDMPWEASE